MLQVLHVSKQIWESKVNRGKINAAASEPPMKRSVSGITLKDRIVEPIDKVASILRVIIYKTYAVPLDVLPATTNCV